MRCLKSGWSAISLSIHHLQLQSEAHIGICAVDVRHSFILWIVCLAQRMQCEFSITVSQNAHSLPMAIYWWDHYYFWPTEYKQRESPNIPAPTHMINGSLNYNHPILVPVHRAQVVVHLAQGCEVACVAADVQVEVVELFAVEVDVGCGVVVVLG